MLHIANVVVTFINTHSFHNRIRYTSKSISIYYFNVQMADMYSIYNLANGNTIMCIRTVIIRNNARNVLSVLLN